MLARLLRLALAAGVGAYLLYFVAHAWLMLRHPFPLDYGEGPLLAQADMLRGGAWWHLYADPAQPPYAVVNYPPLYLLLAAAFSPLVGGALVAGRLLSLLATLGSVAALWRLSRGRAGWLALLFLTIPIVREWSALMRVDMLGLCLGLWGLVVVQIACRSQNRPAQHVLLVASGLLFVACLFTKPSLVAAPGAASLWLGWRALQARAGQQRAAWHAALVLWGTLAGGGALVVALLQWASGGWFLYHVVAANANRWQADLAIGFWSQQLGLRWPLALAAGLALLWNRMAGQEGASQAGGGQNPVALALLYSLLGAATAIGVGKVGAYSNYFLECYAGLVWLVAASARPASASSGRHMAGGRASGLPAACLALLACSMLYYPPLWDRQRLRPAGLVEASPPRFAFGSYNLWHDQQREAEVLAALARVNTALRTEVRAAGPVLFTDMPGLAAQAGVGSRLQVFEQRQLYDQGLATQRALLHELANGTLPLATVDFLGNWLTPEVVELLRRRYAHDGSLGTTDLLRPIEPGPFTALEGAFGTTGAALRLNGFHLVAPVGQAYEPGELMSLTLLWERPALSQPAGRDVPEVVITLLDQGGTAVFASTLPLLYGAFPPEQWAPGTPVQHLQPFSLPDALPAGTYRLELRLREGDAGGAPVALGQVAVVPGGGRCFAETDYFVLAPVFEAWRALGGMERAGLPLTPLVPFAWGRLQCFERACLEMRAGQLTLRPLGEQLYLAETLRAEGCSSGAPGPPLAACAATSTASERFGAASIGPAISGEIERNNHMVQWTRFARVEREPTTGAIGLGRLGDDVQRLAPGVRYRWP